MTAHSTGDRRGGSTLARIFGPFGAARTYRRLLYVFLRFPLGVAYFTVLFTLLSVGVVLTPLLVGVPILALTVAGVGYVGALEAKLARALLDVDVTYVPPDLDSVPLKPFLIEAVTTPHNYVLLVGAFAAFPLGMASFLLLTLALTLSIALVLAPLLYSLPGVTYGLTTAAIGGETTYAVDSFPEALVLTVVGLVVAVGSVHLLDRVAGLLGRVVAVMLDGRGAER